MNRDYAHYRSLFRGRPMPLAFVDLGLFDENVRRIAERAGSKRLRIASKSIRSVPLMRRILEASPTYQGVMCYTGAEAAWLSRAGFDDLLIAYPVLAEDQVLPVAEEVRKGKRVVLMIDCPDHVVALSALARRAGVELPVAIDVDMSSSFPGLHFGVRRSPITRPEQAVELLRSIRGEGGLRLVGVMGYEAQIAGVPDGLPGAALKSAFIRFLKRRSIRELVARRTAVVAALRAEGAALEIVNGGGTGSLETTREEACVTEVTAGSGFYSPTLFDGYRAFRHESAAGFAIEITRHPKPEIYTCHGGGYVASGTPGWNKVPRPYLPIGAKLLELEGTGEVQTPIEYRGGENLELGDPILLRHAKAGELCEHFETLLLVSEGKVVGEAATYRGEGQRFL